MPSNEEIQRRRNAKRNAALRQQRKMLLTLITVLVTVLVILIICLIALMPKASNGDSGSPTGTSNPTGNSTTVPSTGTSNTTFPSSTSGDTIAPVIEIVPMVSHSIYLGDSVPYRSYVTYSDDVTATDALRLNVDRSQVDLTKPGTYPVTYTVTDAANNKASVVIQLTVLERPNGLDQARELANNVLSQITTPEMTKPEIAAAIYNYVKFNIAYSGTSDKNAGWPAGAVDGFTKHAGDCYTYFSTAKALYEAAGIPNVDVVKVKTAQTSSSSHYWSLIDVGNGWYHVDCTPRANNYADSFFLYTDEEMLAYSRNNKNCFNFDTSAYPARETVSVQSHIQFSSTLKVTIKESW